MKILFVNQTPFVSSLGAERSALNAAIGLSERGHEVEFLYCGDATKQQTQKVKGQVFTSHQIKSNAPHPEFSMEAASITLRKWLQQQDMAEYDIVHSHNSAAHVAVEEATVKIPTVGTIRDYRWLCEGDAMCYTEYGCLETCNSVLSQIKCSFSLSDRDIPFLPAIAGQTVYRVRFQNKIVNAIENMDQIISISESLRKIIEQNINADYRIKTIYNSVIYEDYININGDDDKRTNVLFVGSLKPQKGIIETIQAFDLVTKSNPRSQLQIAGDGRLRKKAEELTEALGLQEKVDFLGHVKREKVIDLYNQASVVVYPSIWPEPFGRISIEAMASQTPIVGSKYGAIPEVLDNWPASQIIDPKDGRAFAKAINNQFHTNYSQYDLCINEKYLHSNAAMEHEKLYNNMI